MTRASAASRAEPRSRRRFAGRAREAVVVAALVVSAGPAAASPTYRLEERLTLEVHGDNGNRIDGADDDYGVAIQRLTLGAEADALSVSADIDGEAFVSPPTGDHEDDLRLERVRVAYAGEIWRVDLWDFHRQLGRGIILSLRRVDELGQDVTLRGGRLALTHDDHEADVFAGHTQTSQLDAVSQKHLGDPHDLIAGASYAFRGARWVAAGVHGMHLRVNESVLPEAGRDHTTAAGVFLETPALGDVLALYAEVDWQGRRVAGQGGQHTAAYATADVTIGPVGLLAEVLRLDDFSVRGSGNEVLQSPFDYAQAPTLERIDQEVLDNTDVLGGRLKLSLTLLDGDLVLHGNGMLRRNRPDSDAPLDQVHAYGGFEAAYDDGRSRLNASGGARQETQDDAVLKAMRHAEADWLHALGPVAAHLTVTHEWRTLAEKDYVRGTTFAGVERGGLGGVGVEVGYDTQDPDVRTLFVAGHLSYEALEGWTLRAVGGSQRGGLQCVAGICRDFPSFTGARLEVRTTADLP